MTSTMQTGRAMDMGIFGLYFSASLIFSSIPFAGFLFKGLLFPMCALFLPFRRAVVLSILINVVEILKLTYQLSMFFMITSSVVWILLLPGEVIGIWLFKRLQTRHVISGLIMYYFVGVLVFGIIVIVGLVLAVHLGVFATAQPQAISNELLTQPIPTDAQKMLAENPVLGQVVTAGSTITESLTNVDPNIAVGMLMAFPMGVLVFLLGSFVMECYLLRLIQKRTRGLPLTL